LSSIDEKIKEVANKIIDNLDTSGFLIKKDEELIKEIKCSKQAFNKALKFVQTLEPEGVGSRSLAECFLIQLEIMVLFLKSRSRLFQSRLICF